MRTHNARLLFALLAAWLCGCGSGEPLRVTSIQVGRSLNADGTVASHTTVFAPDDTVYVSVATAGVGSATVGVRWKYAGRVLDEPKKPVSSRDAAVTEFHLQSSNGLWPGDYTVEVLLDGKAVDSKAFRVKRPD